MEELGFIERWTDVIRTIISPIGILNSWSKLANYINFVHAVIVLEECFLSKSIVGKDLAVPRKKLVFQNLGLTSCYSSRKNQKVSKTSNEVEFVVASTQANRERSLSLLKRDIWFLIFRNHSFSIGLYNESWYIINFACHRDMSPFVLVYYLGYTIGDKFITVAHTVTH